MINPSMSAQQRLTQVDWHLNKAEKMMDEYHNPKSSDSTRQGNPLAASVHIKLANGILRSFRERTR